MNMKYLGKAVNSDKTQTIDVQITVILYKFYAKSKMGFTCNDQEKQLKTNANILMSVMWIVEKYWNALLGAEFAQIPEGADEEFVVSELLDALSSTKRPGNKKKE